ncbi:hypothetical protein OH799_06910 [Nocardia sp. NBC_00881]|uniref:hypothetical protein n=1 Tax=Nocardia sp. NBC_00881 TaxID=2975995 RepID=UPI00386B4A28|nr:hypothetical protein OH799_06910 [Nocardia sp. NBC_00881]
MAPVSGLSNAVEVVRLRPLRVSDEQVVLAAHQAMADNEGITFALGLMPAIHDLDGVSVHAGGPSTWDKLARGIVPATYLAATVDDQVVGRM